MLPILNLNDHCRQGDSLAPHYLNETRSYLCLNDRVCLLERYSGGPPWQATPQGETSRSLYSTPDSNEDIDDLSDSMSDEGIARSWNADYQKLKEELRGAACR
jgi:hypothetical protein